MTEQNTEQFQFEYEPGDRVWLTNNVGKHKARIVFNIYGGLVVVTHSELFEDTVQELHSSLIPRGKKIKQRYAEAKEKWEVDQQTKAVDDGRPEVGQEYWYPISNGDIDKDSWHNHRVDIARWEMGNVYATKQDAQNAADLQRLRTRYVRFIAAENERLGWVADWDNDADWKYKHSWRRESQRAELTGFLVLQYKPDAYYFTEQAADQIRSHFTHEEMKIIICGEDYA